MMATIRRRLAGEGGFSLPELLVSITIMAVVSGAVVSSVVAVNRSLGTANATMNDMRVARIGVDRLGQLIRGAVFIDGDLTRSDPGLISATPTDIRLYTTTGTVPANDDNPIWFRLRVDTAVSADCPAAVPNQLGCLVEERINPVPATSNLGQGTYTGTPARRVIIRDVWVVDEDGAAIDVFQFWSHYWDRDDNFDNVVDQPASDRCGREIVPAGSLTLSERRDVDSVSFTVQVRDPGSSYGNSRVTLRGWARFGAAEDIGFSSSFDSAGCLDATDGGFGYDD